MFTKAQLLEAREQLQENLRCILDGADESTLDMVCDAVVSAFKALEG